MRFLRGGGCHTIFPSWTSGLILPRLVTPTARMGRSYCTLTGSDVKNRVEAITELFLDARELLEDAVSIVVSMPLQCAYKPNLFADVISWHSVL